MVQDWSIFCDPAPWADQLMLEMDEKLQVLSTWTYAQAAALKEAIQAIHICKQWPRKSHTTTTVKSIVTQSLTYNMGKEGSERGLNSSWG